MVYNCPTGLHVVDKLSAYLVALLYLGVESPDVGLGLGDVVEQDLLLLAAFGYVGGAKDHLAGAQILLGFLA